jgi:uncharacterized membrane protein YphA (DoxX/SURF4 family)
MGISTSSSATVMRVAFGLMATLAGLDKFFHILVDWDRYLSPFAAQVLPVSPSVFMGAVGVIEIVVGIAILTVLPVIGAYVASAWLLLITGNLVLGGHFDIAVRDAVLSISAFGLARYLAAAAEPAGERRPAPPEGRPVRA